MRGNSKIPVAKPRTREQNVELYKNTIAKLATTRLEQNLTNLALAEGALFKELGFSKSSRRYTLLRKSIAADKKLATIEKKLMSEIRKIGTGARNLRGSPLVPLSQRQIEYQFKHNKRFKRLQKQLIQIRNNRKEIRIGNPALAVLNTEKLDLKSSNKDLFRKVREGFNEVRKYIKKTREKINSGDLDLHALGPIVAQANKKLNVSSQRAKAGDPMSRDSLKWLSSQKSWDKWTSRVTTTVAIGLGVAAIFATGGTATVVLGGAGAAVGVGGAVHELEKADDLTDAARASRGGMPMIDNPEGAESRYRWAIVNLVLLGAANWGAMVRGLAALRTMRGAHKSLMKSVYEAPGNFFKAYSRASVKIDGKYVSVPAFDNINRSWKGFPGLKEVNGNKFQIVDKKAFIDEVKKLYQTESRLLNGAKNPGPALDPAIEKRILKFINGKHTFKVTDGVPGLHAEVRAVNAAVQLLRHKGKIGPLGVQWTRISVATVERHGGQLQNFVACGHCSGVLPGSWLSPRGFEGVQVITGKRYEIQPMTLLDDIQPPVTKVPY